MQKLQTAEEERATAETNHFKVTEEEAKAQAKVKLDQADKNLAQALETAVEVESVGSIRQKQEAELKLAFEEIYKCEAAERKASEDDNAIKKEDPAKAASIAAVKTATDNLETAKERWLIAKHALQATETRASVSSLEARGISTMKVAISGHLKSLQSDISATQAQLSSTTAGLGDAPSAIIGVTESKALIRTDGNTTEKPESTATASTAANADVWTKVAFSVGSSSSSSSTSESNISGTASLEVGRWCASVKASTSFSSSSKKV